MKLQLVLPIAVAAIATVSAACVSNTDKGGAVRIVQDREPNNTSATATVLTSNGGAGEIAFLGDCSVGNPDFFKGTADRGGKVEMSIIVQKTQASTPSAFADATNPGVSVKLMDGNSGVLDQADDVTRSTPGKLSANLGGPGDVQFEIACLTTDMSYMGTIGIP
ncbi:MAG TPA: hypothetical protein VMV18_09800 [bacterium]|nr:hypothetical protein [bacterium]